MDIVIVEHQIYDMEGCKLEPASRIASCFFSRRVLPSLRSDWQFHFRDNLVGRRRDARDWRGSATKRRQILKHTHTFAFSRLIGWKMRTESRTSSNVQPGLEFRFQRALAWKIYLLRWAKRGGAILEYKRCQVHEGIPPLQQRFWSTVSLFSAGDGSPQFSFHKL